MAGKATAAAAAAEDGPNELRVAGKAAVITEEERQSAERLGKNHSRLCNRILILSWKCL